MMVVEGMTEGDGGPELSAGELEGAGDLDNPRPNPDDDLSGTTYK